MADEGSSRLLPRPADSPLEVVLAAADDLRGIARAGIVYARAIYSPNIKEPFYIANRRGDLVDRVRAYDGKHRARRAARRAA